MESSSSRVRRGSASVHHLDMTSHSSLQLPRPPSAATKKPAGRVEEAIESFNALLQLPVVSRARFLPSSSTEGAPQNSESLSILLRTASAHGSHGYSFNSSSRAPRGALASIPR